MATTALHVWRIESPTHPELTLSVNELCQRAKEHNEDGVLGLPSPFLRLAIGGPDGRELSLTTLAGSHTVEVQGALVEAGSTRLVHAGDVVRITGLQNSGESGVVELRMMR